MKLIKVQSMPRGTLMENGATTIMLVVPYYLVSWFLSIAKVIQHGEAHTLMGA